MVLCASSEGKDAVELIRPKLNVPNGSRVSLEGITFDNETEKVLKTKEVTKILE